MKLTVNLNDKVKVRLTEHGRRLHKQLTEEFMVGFKNWVYEEPKTDYKGYCTFQLWELMSVFGPMMHLGGQVPFETEILIAEEF